MTASTPEPSTLIATCWAVSGNVPQLPALGSFRIFVNGVAKTMGPFPAGTTTVVLAANCAGHYDISTNPLASGSTAAFAAQPGDWDPIGLSSPTARGTATVAASAGQYISAITP